MAIGSVSVHVTPDATDFWRRFREQTRADTPDVDIRVRADTAAARAEIERLRLLVAGQHGVNVNVGASGAAGATGQVNLLRDAIATLGSAAVPIAGVLGGALIGLVPVVTTLALGLAGIKDEMKSGALAGTAYGADISTLKTELGALKAQAAGGILTGLHAALAGSKPLFREINTDTAIMSRQLGGIVAGAAPALARIFTQLNPLFTTFGDLLVRGAASLNHWAQNSTGVASFVAYVQAELPQVVHLVSDLAVFLGHVVQAAAPFGGVVLGGVGALVHALAELPVGVLQVLVPLLAATRVGFLAWRGISGAVDGVTAAVGRLSGATGRAQIASQVAAAQLQLTAAQNEATIAAEASAIALARASEAETAADAALAQAAAARSVSATAAAEADAVATAKVAEAEAYLAAAEAAAVAAATTAAAADAAAADVVAAGTVARVGWTAMLGPIGALVIGLGILAASFISSNKDTNTAADANAAYAESVKQSTNALAAANVKATADQLSKSGALDLTNQLTTANKGLKLTFLDLAQAVNGPQAGFDALIKKLKDYAALHAEKANGTDTGSYDAEGTAALALLGKLTTLRGTLSHNIDEQTLLNEAMRQNQALADGNAGSLATLSRAYDTATQTGDGFLAALKTFSGIAAPTAADRAALIGATLKAAGGDALNFGAAMSGAAAANSALTGAFATQSAAITSAAAQVTIAQDGVAAANDGVRTAEQSLTSAQQQSLTAQKSLTQARLDAKASLEDLRNQVIDGALSERRAVIDLHNAQAAYAKTPNVDTKLALDQAVQGLSELRLSNQRLAEQKRIADKAGIGGSTQVIAAQRGVTQAANGVTSAQKGVATATKGVASANKSLNDALAAQRLAFTTSERAAINAKTGLIDYSKAGAAPLVGQLQAMQDAAMKAAEATYQHELRTKGAKSAAEDAYKIYQSETSGSLIDEASKLGLTKDQAKHLADQYFNMPKTVKTLIGQEGAGPVVGVLNQIGTQLSFLTGHPWVTKVATHVDYSGINAFEARLNRLAGRHVYAAVNTNTGAAAGPGAAAGTGPGGLKPGWGTVGERGWEAVYTAGGKTQVFSHEMSQQILGVNQAPGYSAGTTPPPDNRPASHANSPAANISITQNIVNPLPETASVSGPAGLRRAALALGRP